MPPKLRDYHGQRHTARDRLLQLSEASSAAPLAISASIAAGSVRCRRMATHSVDPRCRQNLCPQRCRGIRSKPRRLANGRMRRSRSPAPRAAFLCARILAFPSPFLRLRERTAQDTSKLRIIRHRSHSRKKKQQGLRSWTRSESRLRLGPTDPLLLGFTMAHKWPHAL
jgi:hypothetical protein